MQHILYRTKRGIEIGVNKGRKSRFDFKVKYKEPGKRERTPKHIHIIIDLYMKKQGNENLTLQLVDYIINLINNVKPATTYPPNLQFFNPQLPVITRLLPLNDFGEYSVEFLLTVVELIMIQEKTNYPNGVMNLNLFRKFRMGADIFSVVSAATFR